MKATKAVGLEGRETREELSDTVIFPYKYVELTNDGIETEL